jgi:hypothetical protein
VLHPNLAVRDQALEEAAKPAGPFTWETPIPPEGSIYIVIVSARVEQRASNEKRNTRRDGHPVRAPIAASTLNRRWPIGGRGEQQLWCQESDGERHEHHSCPKGKRAVMSLI